MDEGEIRIGIGGLTRDGCTNTLLRFETLRDGD
jgi:hypothetical protein